MSEQFIIETVKQILKIESSDFSLDNKLVYDLNMDSLALVEFITILEEELSTEFDIDTQMQIIQGSVQDIINLFAK